MLRAPTGRGRDGTAGRFDAMRNARRVSDRFGAQFRDCDEFQFSVVDDRRRFAFGRAACGLQRQRSGNTGLAGSIDKSC